MAGSKSPIAGTATTTAATPTYTMPRDGVFKASITRDAGSGTFGLKTRAGDGTFVDAYDASGNIIEQVMSDAAPHFSVEILALAGEEFYFLPSDLTSADFDYLYGRCGGV